MTLLSYSASLPPSPLVLYYITVVLLSTGDVVARRWRGSGAAGDHWRLPAAVGRELGHRAVRAEGAVEQ